MHLVHVSGEVAVGIVHELVSIGHLDQTEAERIRVRKEAGQKTRKTSSGNLGARQLQRDVVHRIEVRGNDHDKATDKQDDTKKNVGLLGDNRWDNLGISTRIDSDLGRHRCCLVVHLGSETKNDGKDNTNPAEENHEHRYLRLGYADTIDLVLRDDHLLESLLVEANLLLALNDDNGLEEDNLDTLLVQEISIRIRLKK